MAVVSGFPYTEPQAPPSLPLLASVLFLRIREFGALSAEEQARQRSSAIQLTGKLLRLWPDDARVVLQVADGTAIVGLDNPGLAMDAAERAAGHAGLVLGLHHGPVETIELDEVPRLRGEGIASAHALAGLPQAQPLVVTGEFRQALLAADRRRAESLRHAGDFVDPDLRSHEISMPSMRPFPVRADSVACWWLELPSRVFLAPGSSGASRAKGTRRVDGPL